MKNQISPSHEQLVEMMRRPLPTLSNEQSWRLENAIEEIQSADKDCDSFEMACVFDGAMFDLLRSLCPPDLPNQESAIQGLMFAMRLFDAHLTAKQRVTIANQYLDALSYEDQINGLAYSMFHVTTQRSIANSLIGFAMAGGPRQMQ